jgi:hypothetical protein
VRQEVSVSAKSIMSADWSQSFRVLVGVENVKTASLPSLKITQVFVISHVVVNTMK